MKTTTHPDIFSKLHIDIARNSTDDFDWFHDGHKWSRIKDNPYNGPVVLNFQLESLIEGKIAEFRQQHDDLPLIAQHGLNFSNYEFSFAEAVKPGQQIEVEIQASEFKTEPAPVLSNRLIVKADGKQVWLGHKSETATPLYLGNPDFSRIGELKIQPDRCFLNNGYFLKRKFMMTSNAKNFLCGSLRDQRLYFDEMEDKVNFPEIFPCALLSSALLEKALKWLHDFEHNPMVYTSHKISIDKRCLAQLKSNDVLHILIKPTENGSERDFGDLTAAALDYVCYGVFGNDNTVLFRALISLAPLASINKVF